MRSSGRNRSRSTPQSTTSVFAAASGIDATSCPRSHSETAITAAALFTTRRAGGRTNGYSVRFATSCPWAVTTRGARAASPASSPERPVGKRKCA